MGDNEDILTVTQIRSIYDELGIELGVDLPCVTPEAQYYLKTNEESYELAQTFPETLDWFCNLDPRMGGNSTETDFSKFINYYKEMGAKGVGEIMSNMYFDDPRTLNLFKHCEACKMPVLFHIGGPVGDYGLIDDLGLPRLEKVLQMFPNLQFLGHSQKFWAEISSDVTEEGRYGFPTGKVTPGRVVELMRKYPNLCGDLSAGSGGNAVMRDPEFGYAFLEEFQDRLYFGTDICSVKNERPLSFWLDKACEDGNISQIAYEKICRENAYALLHRKL
ncbi:MAG: amidohydrolase family protein [Clostridia bacterium]|nr:amidohydrolase family protein [Clostridia bacterium]